MDIKLPVPAPRLLATVRNDTGVVYLSGSIADGYGNPQSDLDLFVVSPERVPLRYSTFGRAIDIREVEGRRVDVEYWDEAAIEEMAKTVNSQRPGSEEGSRMSWAEQVLTFVHRLRIGIPLRNPEGFRELQSRFDFATAKGVLLELKIRAWSASLEDAVGAMDAGQWETAALNARYTLFSALEAYLSSRGETNPNPKWVYAHLHRHHERGSPLHQLIWQYDHCDVPIDRIADYVRGALGLASDLAMAAQLGEIWEA